MESIHKLENMIEGWLKPIPHLPTEWRKWLAANVWWITLVGVVLSVIGVLGLIFALINAMAIFGAVSSFYSVYGVSTAQTYTGWWILATAVSLVFLVVTIVIEAMAVKPLKSQNKKGWDLMFLVFLIGVVSQLVGIVLNFNAMSLIPSIIFTALGIAIGAYFLFELRSYFKGAIANK
jgi:hypothetical protein